MFPVNITQCIMETVVAKTNVYLLHQSKAAVYRTRIKQPLRRKLATERTFKSENHDENNQVKCFI